MMVRSHTMIAAPNAQGLLSNLCGNCPLHGTPACAAIRGCARLPDGLCSMLACGGSLHLLCESETPDALHRIEAAIAARLAAAADGAHAPPIWHVAA